MAVLSMREKSFWQKTQEEQTQMISAAIPVNVAARERRVRREKRILPTGSTCLVSSSVFPCAANEATATCEGVMRHSDV